MKKFQLLRLAVTLTVLSSFHLSLLTGQDAPVSSDTREHNDQAGDTADESIISVQSAIDIALQNNLDLRLGRFAPEIAEQDVEKSRAEFSPVLNGAITTSERRDGQVLVTDETDPDLIHATTNEYASSSLAMGVSKKFETGALVAIDTTLNSSQDNIPDGLNSSKYDSGLSISLQQPLLRGRGRNINLANISRSRSGYQQSVYEFRQTVVGIISNTISSYYDVAYAHGRKNLEETSIAVAEQLLEETREKERLGLVTQLEVLQAEASLASRREALIIARQNIDNAADAMLYTLGLLALAPDLKTSLTLPENSISLPDYATTYRNAREFDFNLQIQEESVYQSNINLDLARNGKLPRVDLEISGGLAGQDNDLLSATGDTLEREDTNWSAGVRVTIPWGFQEEKATLKQAELIVQRETTRLDKIEQDLMLRVRAAWRDMSTALERLHVTNTTLKLREEQFQKEKAKFDAGLSTFRNVLETQEDLDRARQSRLDALIAVIKADIALIRLDGTILTRYGFSWETLDPQTRESLINN